MNNSEDSKTPINAARLKEYGKKSYQPLISVVFKYQDEITPYFRALQKGLRGGAETLNKEGANEKDKYVSKLFKDAAEGLDQAFQKLESRDREAFSAYVSNLADKRPSLIFSSSYLAGLLLGRLGRHFARHNIHSVSEPISSERADIKNESASFDQSLH